MTQHVNQGGTFADQVGEQIMRMTSDFSNLAQASNFVAGNAPSLTEGALEVREACRANMRDLRKSFHRLSKSSSYTKEFAELMEKVKTLNETDVAVDETRLGEMRRLLNDADLPHEVYECACKAMDRAKAEKPITEAPHHHKAKVHPVKEPDADDDVNNSPDYVPNSATTVKTFVDDHLRVNRKAWEALAHGKLELKGKPQIADKEGGVPHFKSRYAELCYKLGALIPVVADDTLANLLQRVLTNIEDYTETGIAPMRVPPQDEFSGYQTQSEKDAYKPGVWRARFVKMIRLAKHALKAADMPLEEELASGNHVVREYIDWLRQFDPDRVLSEAYGMGGMDPYSMIGDKDAGDAHDDAQDDAVKNFDASEFVDSPEVEEMLGDRNPDDPEENRLSHDDVMNALRSVPRTSYRSPFRLFQ